MDRLTKSRHREIIEDFAREIEISKTADAKPQMDVIKFRNEHITGKERIVYFVPLELLRYRKDNGRISSDVLDYEKNHEPLIEKSEKAQQIIKGFLEKKDPDRTEELKRSILQEGQRAPAIITCDGFLINGNRRKMGMELLLRDYPGDAKLKHMKVVILPGKNDEGGPPTLLEIEEIENRYQFQSEGKAEYYGFDKALSMRKKMKVGMDLEQQMRDDPFFISLPEKEFKEAVKKIESEYLKPLECIDRYLNLLDRPGLYTTVSTGSSDREGRWEAFKDYSKFRQRLEDEKKRMQLGITEDEVGDIEDVAFKIIRKRDLKELPKVHMIMRELPKWLSKKDPKEELLKLTDVDLTLPTEKRFDKDGHEYDERTLDKIWGEQHASVIINHVKKAKHIFEHKKERETPLTLLDAALKKLTHEDMDTNTVAHIDMEKAMDLTRKIQKRANELEKEFYHHLKDLKHLPQKHAKK